MNTIKQGTQKWKNIKKCYFGANDCASLYAIGFNDPCQVVENKVSYQEEIPSEESLQIMDRGNRYEDTVRDLLAQRHNISITPTGLKFHKRKDLYFLTASPDGYCKSKDYLLEFKVRRELSSQIPEKYWVQMQIQMEVWDIDKCMYCENVIKEYPDKESYLKSNIPVISHLGTLLVAPTHGETLWNNDMYYWRHIDYREQLVHRDKEWFTTKMEPILHHYWSLVLKGRNAIQIQTRSRKRTYEEYEEGKHADASTDPSVVEADEQQRKRRRYLESKENMIYPYMVSNYIRQDPLLDWLNLHGDYTLKDKDTNIFMSMIRHKNNEFHEQVVRYITNLYPNDVFNADPNPFERVDIVESHTHKMTHNKILATKNAMRRQFPIIFNPYFTIDLDTYPHPLGGRADMIIRNDHIQQILGFADIDEINDKYSIVNFKYATINLRADKQHLLNNTKQKSYKAQMWLLNLMLTHTQEYQSDICYIIGRKYDCKVRGQTLKINNAFKGIGVIDFSEEEYDAQYEKQCLSALDWLAEIRNPEASAWDPYNPTRIEMYPNMKNSYDHPWHNVKTDVANYIKDITLMYKCGPKVRDFAHEKGITEWTGLTKESISYRTDKILSQIMNFVDSNSNKTCTPLKIGGKLPTLRQIPCIEFYMDFESIGNLHDNFSTFPEASNYAMIFLIGVVIVDNVAGTKEYRSYIVDKLTHDAELQIINKMLSDFIDLRKKYNQNFSPVYYWSNAENYMLKRAIGGRRLFEEQLVLIDLCKFFKESGLILPGQMGYGLKSVATVMHKNNFIHTIWGNDSDISDGLNAMIEAIRTYKYRPEHKDIFFSNVLNYNYVDCKVMEEIMNYLRSNSEKQEDADMIARPVATT